MRRRLGNESRRVVYEDCRGHKAYDGWNYSGARLSVDHDHGAFSLGLYWFLDGVRSPNQHPGGFLCVYKGDEDLVYWVTVEDLLARTSVFGWFDALATQIEASFQQIDGPGVLRLQHGEKECQPGPNEGGLPGADEEP